MYGIKITQKDKRIESQNLIYDGLKVHVSLFIITKIDIALFVV